MGTYPVEDLVPTVACLQLYRERVLGVKTGSPFDDLAELRRIRVAIMDGIKSAIEVVPTRHRLLAEAIIAQPGRRYFRSGDVIYVVEGEFVISAFLLVLSPESLGCLILRPCLANFAQKVLRLDPNRNPLQGHLAMRITTMILADLLQSDFAVSVGGVAFWGHGGAPSFCGISDRAYKLEVLDPLVIVRAIITTGERATFDVNDIADGGRMTSLRWVA